MTASKEMNRLIDQLSQDWNFIERFLENPVSALEDFKLTDDERRALVTSDASQLSAIGLSDKELNIAMSGAHSPTCTRVVDVQAKTA